MKLINYIGIGIAWTGLILAFIWFSWKLPLIIFLVITGYNLEMYERK